MSMVIVDLGVSGDSGVRSCPPYLRHLKAEGAVVRAWSLGGANRWGKLRFVASHALVLRRADVVVVNEYILTWLVALVLRLTRSRARLVAAGFNVSGTTLAVGRAWLQRLISWPFRRIDLAIVASRIEVTQFARLHGIPEARFGLVPWSYDLPASDSTLFQGRARPFFCIVGRNNRDFDTFCAAVAGVEADGVVISSQPAPPDLPPGLDWFTDLPLADCIDAIRNACANVILLNDTGRGAGHITMVTAMHCGTAQIVTDAPTVWDYVEDGVSAIGVGVGATGAVRQAMQLLLDDSALRQRLGQAGQDRAARDFTHARMTARMEQVLRRFVADRAVLAAP